MGGLTDGELMGGLTDGELIFGGFISGFINIYFSIFFLFFGYCYIQCYPLNGIPRYKVITICRPIEHENCNGLSPCDLNRKTLSSLLSFNSQCQVVKASCSFDPNFNLCSPQL